MKNIENKIKEYILGDLFSDTPKDIYILEERDIWYSSNDVVQLGVFDSIEKAVEASTEEYGELQEDGSDCHFEPIKNPHNVKLFIEIATLNVFEEL